MLVVTIDTPVAGIRERDLRNGMTELLKGNVFSKLPFLPQFFTRPGWVASFLLDRGAPQLENVIGPGKGPMPLTDVTSELNTYGLSWSDFRWLHESWKGLIIIKGC